MYILWSDDCLSCLAGFPHSVEQHTQAMHAAQEALRQEREDRRAANRDLFEDEEETTPAVEPSWETVSWLFSLLQQSYHGY